MANPAWFNDEYFAGQKLLQMQILGETIPAGNSDLEKLQAALDDYNTQNGASVDVFANFEACNTQGYIAEIPASAINVSPNALFDIPYYLTAAAKYANDEGYTATGFDGVWTAETVLQHMYEGGYSAWAHFMAAGLDQRLDCSADFSTSKYIAAKAAALNTTEDDVVAQMKAAGLNPVMDYYENGIGLGIELADLGVDPANVQNVAMGNGDQWGTLAPADSYDAVGEYVTVAAGDNGPYVGRDNVNTQFEAKHRLNAAENTLSADDVITGGAGGALNTLAVELGRDWTGFNGVEDPSGGDPTPNVTNVGRIKIDRQTDGASERALTFNAKNISDDAVQYDINAAGTGATNLTNLSGAVTRVNYANQVTPTGGNDVSTSLDWQSGVHKGKDDSLTIGLNNVCEGNSGLLKVGGLEGIETVTVDSMGGAMNNVDVSSAADASVINVTGAANVNVRTGATTKLKTLDASTATGDVEFALATDGMVNQTITGGAGNDTVNVVAGSSATAVNVIAANWTSIEALTLSEGKNDGSTTINVNAQGAQDIESIWLAADGTNAVRNLAAGDVTVYQTAADTGTNSDTINGNSKNNELGNIKWVTASGEADGDSIKANFSSNATGTATIEVTGKDTLADQSQFTFSQATNVVINDPNQLAGTGGAGSGYGTGIDIKAANATSLDITMNGGLKFGTSTDFGKLQNLTVDLTSASSNVASPNAFEMDGVALPELLKGEINAGGESVKLGKIGTYDATAANAKGSGFTLDINEANAVTLGDMGAALGGNINVTVTDATDDITLGNITTSTNQSVNGQGDVNLSFSTTGGVDVTGGKTIIGGDLNIDFGDVLGNVAGTTSGTDVLKLSAQEAINYQGAIGKDWVQVNAVAKGSTSFISTGLGDDEVKIEASALADKSTLTVDLGDGAGGDKLTVAASVVASGGTATLNVICGAGKDALDITTSTGGKLLVYVDGFEAGTDAVSSSSGGSGFTASAPAAWSNVAGWANGINSAFGLNLGSDGQVVKVDGSSENGYYVNGNLYVVGEDGVTSSVTTLVVLQGVTLDGDGFDLNGNSDTTS